MERGNGSQPKAGHAANRFIPCLALIPFAAAGIPSLQYGAGDIRTYKEWPTPDERVQLADLVTAPQAIAYAAYRLCR